MDTNGRWFRARILPNVALGVLLSLATRGRADTLNVPLDPAGPTITAFSGSLTYTAGTGHLTARGEFPMTLASPDVPFALFEPDAIMNIDLLVNSGGTFISSGDGFSLIGSIDIDSDGTDDVSGDAINPLLSGPITAFGAQSLAVMPPVPWSFDLLFTVTGGKFTMAVPLSGGGTLSPMFAPGQTLGAVVTAESVTSGTLGDFNSDFSSDTTKTNAGAIVPLPKSASMGAVILAGLMGCRLLRYAGAIRQ